MADIKSEVPFSKKDKVTTPGGDYANANSEAKGNWAEKNASISRLDLVNKSTSTSPTAYNGLPIPETYKCATSNGEPDANAVEYKTKMKDQNTH